VSSITSYCALALERVDAARALRHRHRAVDAHAAVAVALDQRLYNVEHARRAREEQRALLAAERAHVQQQLAHKLKL
jgi:hypothetical protein